MHILKKKSRKKAIKFVNDFWYLFYVILIISFLNKGNPRTKEQLRREGLTEGRSTVFVIYIFDEIKSILFTTIVLSVLSFKKKNLLKNCEISGFIVIFFTYKKVKWARIKRNSKTLDFSWKGKLCVKKDI